MNGLVYIGKVIEIVPIPEADQIVQAIVVCGAGGKWSGVVRKVDVSQGDIVEAYLPDSLLPATDRFAFMQSRKYRVRQARFKGCPSTCLIMPMGEQMIMTSQTGIGMDITDIIGVTKYEKPIPASMSGKARGNFPAFIPKTDEPYYQKSQHLVEALQNQPFYVTLKYDGCSGTAYLDGDNRFGVCSRNLELIDAPGCVWWEMAKKYRLEEALRNFGAPLAVQFEVIGPGVQGNPLGLKEHEIKVFDIYWTGIGQYGSLYDLKRFCRDSALPMVEVLLEGGCWGLGEAGMQGFAESTKYPNGKPGEGVVIRPQVYQTVGYDRLSFKVVNLLYKD